MSAHSHDQDPLLCPPWPRTFTCLLESLQAHFVRQGFEYDHAADLAEGCIVEIAQTFGGRTIYMPKGSRIQLALRNQRIRRAYDGTNLRELAARHSLSEMQVRNIIKQDTINGQ